MDPAGIVSSLRREASFGNNSRRVNLNLAVSALELAVFVSVILDPAGIVSSLRREASFGNNSRRVNLNLAVLALELVVFVSVILDPAGIEPASHGCQPGVLPID